MSTAEVVDIVTIVGQAITPFALIVAGFWALFSFGRARRSVATRWAVEQFKSFYTDPHLLTARQLIEHRFEADLAPILQLRVVDRDVRIDPTHVVNKAHFDYFMNFLEQLLYLEKQGELRTRDRDTFFSYWLSLLNEPKYGPLRRYVCRRGFELLAETVRATHKDHEHVAVYGTLLSGTTRQEQLGLDSRLSFFAASTITGTLWDLPTCPGYTPDGQREHAIEIYCVPVAEERLVFDILDWLEEYAPGNDAGSRFVRRSMWDARHELDFWVYLITEDAIPENSATIAHADWLDFVSETGKALPPRPPHSDSMPESLRQRIGQTSLFR